MYIIQLPFWFVTVSKPGSPQDVICIRIIQKYFASFESSIDGLFTLIRDLCAFERECWATLEGFQIQNFL